MVSDTKTARNMKLAAEIFEEHGDTIRAAIRFHINDKSSIDDIFQDFFLSLVERPIPRRDQNIRAFIHKSVRNDVIDAAAEAKHHYLRNCRYAQMHKDRCKSQTPDEIVIHVEEIHELFDIVENQMLPYETEAIIQKYRYDKDAAQTARVMGISQRSVSCYLCTGMKKLRNIVRQRQPLPDEYAVDAEVVA